MWWTKAASGSGRDNVEGPASRAASPAAHYDAFISYSHAADNLLAPMLRNSLQRFATPWRVFSLTNPTRLLRIFHDQASLSANAKLWPAIEAALIASDWFILFGSSVAADSPWVGREVDFWCLNKPVDRLLIVQTDGEIVWDAATGDFDWSRTTALPTRLRAVFADEPRWIDARWARTSSQASLKDPRFRDLVAELASPLRGVEKDELIGEDIRLVRRLELWRNAALGMLSLLLAGATAAAVLAVRQRSLAEQRLATAQRSESKALSLLANAELDASGPATSVRIALAALPQSATSGSRPLVVEAEAALRRSLLRLRELRHFADGQESLVLAAAQAPDGSRIVTGRQDGTIELWDVATGKTLRLLLGRHSLRTTTGAHQGSAVVTDDAAASVVLVAFSADGRYIVTVDAMATARVWEVASGKPLATLRSVDQLKLSFLHVSAAASREGRFVVLTGVDGAGGNNAVLWDSVSGMVSVLQHRLDPNDNRGVARHVVFADFSADGQTLITGSSDHSVWLWDVAGAKPMRELVGHTGTLVFANFSGDGRMLVTAATDGSARRWEVSSGTQLTKYAGGGGRINGAALSPDGQALVTAHEDGTARLWDISGAKAPKVLNGHQGALNFVSFSGDGGTILTTSRDKTARLWETASAREMAVLRGHGHSVEWGAFTPDALRVLTRESAGIRLWDATMTGNGVAVRTSHDGEVRSVAFSRDGRTILTAGWDNTARLSDAQSLKEPAVLRHPVFNVEFAAFSPDGRHVLTVAGDGIARVWPGDLSEKMVVLRHSEGAIEFAAFTADGQSVITAGGSTLQEWDLSAIDRVRVHQLVDHRAVADYQRPIALSPDGRQLVGRFSNDKNGLWDLVRDKVAWIFPGMNIDSAKFSPDGRRLVTLDASEDGIARVWDAESGRSLAVLRHQGHVKSVAFSPDAETLATVTNDGLIRIWDVASERELETVGTHANANAVVFSHDGRSIASASNDVRVWPLMPRRQDLIDLACARVPWPLPLVERERLGISEEWCVPGVSQDLRAKIGTDRLSGVAR